MLLISIIIPIFNAGTFLEKCLKSLLKQTYNNIEIICINDGSTDNSIEILKKFKQQDNRIKIISQENQGVSAARNIGIKNANGEYIIFCDSDDYVKEELCQEIITKIIETHADIIVFGYDELINNQIITTKLKNPHILKQKNSNFEDTLYLQSFVWEKAFKRDFLLKNKIYFPKGIKNAEDMVFCILNFLNGAKYESIEKSLYVYRKEKGGKTTFSNPHGIKNDLEAYKYLCNTHIFKTLSREKQLLITNFFLGGATQYYKTQYFSNNRNLLISALKEVDNFLTQNFNKNEFKQIKNWQHIKFFLFKDKFSWFFSIFNIISYPTEKIFIFFGFKLKIARKNKTLVKKGDIQ